MKFGLYVISCVFIAGFVHPLPAYWAWEEHGNLKTWKKCSHAKASLTKNKSLYSAGWLKSMGIQDVEGIACVHLVGAAFGLAGAIALGPRIGVFTPKGR